MKISKIIQKKNKQAQGHVEMIISFLIFVSFVVVLLIFLNPTKSRQIDYTLLTITEEKLMEEWMRNYSSVSVTISQDKIGDVDIDSCFKVPNTLGLSGNLIVKDENGDIVEGAISGDISINHKTGNRHYKIHASSEFDDNSYSCPKSRLDIEDFKFGALTEFDVVMTERVYNLIDEYNRGPESYNALKERLGLTNDFMIFVYDQDVNLLANASMFVPRVVEVVARDIPVVGLDNDANPVEIIVNIRTW